MTPAEQIRRQWCRLYGMDDDEIEESIRDFPPFNEESERRQLDAMGQIQEGRE